MYLGRIVELSSSDKLFRHPLHPYTEALLSAVPVPDPQYRVKPILLQGDVPSPTDVPAGCPFHPRCGYFKEGLCDQEVPSLREVEKDHFVSCHRAEEISLKGLDQLLNL
jgi:peptide/nickel transport system ATP-binding protein